MNEYAYCAKQWGGTPKMWKGLQKVMHTEECSYPTLREYIESNPEVLVCERISKNGTEMLTVRNPDGTLREYQKQRLDREIIIP